MATAMKFMEGYVRLRIRCRYPERFINLCAREGVAFRDVSRPEADVMELTVPTAGYRKLREMRRKSGLFTLTVLRKAGAPFILWNMRRRYTLFLGLVFAFALAWFSSFFVWQIDISGNETVPDAEILEALRAEGVDIGTSTFAISRDQVSNRLMLRLKELAWITVNVHGSRAYVLCRERVPVPEVIDYTAPRSVYAAKPGLIEGMTVLRGRPVSAVGNTVLAGDLLVEGGEKTRADARVTARTWYTLTEKMPLTCLEKTLTGRTTTRRAVIFCGKRINFYFNGGNPYAEYDKITVYDEWKLPGDSILPVVLVTERWEEARLQRAVIPADKAESLLRARLLARLEVLIGSGRTEKLDFTAEEENGVLTVTLSAECAEEIAEVGDWVPGEP